MLMKRLLQLRSISFILLLVIAPVTKGQSISAKLTDLEKIAYQDAGRAFNELNNLADEIKTSNRTTKLRWLLLMLTAAYDHSNYQGVLTLADTVPNLLSTNEKGDKYWIELLQMQQQLIEGKFADILPVLQSFEKEIIAVNEPFLTAFFHNMLFFIYSVNGMPDFALDMAIVNRKEWIQLEQYYYALEVLVRIARYRLNLSDLEGASEAVDMAKLEAEKLEAANMNIGIIELKSDILLAQEKHREAFDILNDLLVSNTITPDHDKYQSVLNNTAYAAFNADEFQRTIDLAQESLNLPVQKTPGLSAYLMSMMAKAHNELGNHEQAEALIKQSREIYDGMNNQFGLFETEQVLIDIFYNKKDIEKLYQTTKELIDRITNYDDNQGKRRVERSAKIAHAEEQSKVVEELAQENIEKSEALDTSNQLLTAKNQYLRILAVFCVLLVVLMVWSLYLLKRNKRLANRDALTGIHNRRCGLKKAEKLAKKALAKNVSIGVSILDLDHFKRINDTFGHDVGDSVLIETAAEISKVIGKDDVFCRMGGEEFLIASASNDHQSINSLMQTVIDKISQIPVSRLRTDKPVTASAGLRIVSSEDGVSLKSQIIDADFALYHAKENGRNRLSSFSPEMVF
ncbi:GGDEF domain-containing protein [Thalassotalea fusca]